MTTTIETLNEYIKTLKYKEERQWSMEVKKASGDISTVALSSLRREKGLTTVRLTILGVLVERVEV